MTGATDFYILEIQASHSTLGGHFVAVSLIQAPVQWHSRPATQAVPAKINLNNNVRKATALKHNRSLRTATSSSA